MSDLTAERFHNEDAARKFLEALRWPSGPVCPHCGVIGEAYATKRPGVYRCAAKECRKDFSVTVGTLFERSHIPLHKWLLATHLLMSGKNGVSAHELHRMLGVTYKTAWFMAHRIREALRPHSGGQLGGQGKVVEADETFIGGKEKNRHASKRAKKRLGGSWGKETVFSLVEREGRVRSTHVKSVTATTLRPILRKQIAEETQLVTDDAGQYRHVHEDFPTHQTVNHSIGEYVRGDIHSNTVENYFSNLKRGLTGTYRRVSPAHLKRYLAEFDFRHNERMALGVSDSERAAKALLGIEGKRLTYGGSAAR